MFSGKVCTRYLEETAYKMSLKFLMFQENVYYVGSQRFE